MGFDQVKQIRGLGLGNVGRSDRLLSILPYGLHIVDSNLKANTKIK